MQLPISRAEAEAMDAADPLAHLRAEFILADDLLYLDGNSLGPLTKRAKARVEAAVAAEWGEGLIRSWNTAGWIDLPRRIAGKIAPLIGAAADDLAVCDSTSVNLFKVLSAALQRDDGRRVILSDRRNFPTDLYVADGIADQFGATLRLSDDPPADLSSDVAVLMLTEVDYRSGHKYDMAAVTAAAHAVGATVIWDLAHSAGAFPVDLMGADADYAVGCGYKYLNGGPGAPAFLWVHPRNQNKVPALRGWFGHARPFAFDAGFAPAAGTARYYVGTAPVLSMTALDAALDVMDGVDLATVARKSAELAAIMIGQVEAGTDDLTLISPRDPAVRGSQISFRHERGEGYALCQAAIAQGLIGDYREPDVVRFGFAPLYVRHVDAFDAGVLLAGIARERTYDRPEFYARAAVT
ncbi:MAG: kynureninase [Pseudomonadota bacterium]